MKNNEEMYQSVLLRRAEYREKKNRRIIIIKRTVPAIACFCFAAVIGTVFHTAKLSRTPEQSDIIEDTTIKCTDAFTTCVSSTEVQTTMKNAAVTSDLSAASVHTTSKKATDTNRHQTTGTVVTDADSGVENVHTETNAVTSKPVHTNTNAKTSKPVRTNTTVRTEHKTTASTASATAPKTTKSTAVTEITATRTTRSPVVTQAVVDTTGYISPTVQPVYFYTVSDIVDAVERFFPQPIPQTTGTSVTASEHTEEVYSQMYSKIQNDGCIFAVRENDAVVPKDDFGFYLFPYARFEDIGVGGYAEFNGSLYNVTFYYTYRTPEDDDGIADYLHERMGRRCDEEIDINGHTVSICNSDDGRIYADFFIDECHYIEVAASVSEDEMCGFLNMLEYETINF